MVRPVPEFPDAPIVMFEIAAGSMRKSRWAPAEAAARTSARGSRSLRERTPGGSPAPLAGLVCITRGDGPTFLMGLHRENGVRAVRAQLRPS